MPRKKTTTKKKTSDAEIVAGWLEDLEASRRSLKHFAFNLVNTKDEHDRDSPIKPFPHKDYLKVYFNYRENGDDIQYVAKSRQLMISWCIAVEAVWWAKFHPHSLCLIQSKKHEDAAKLVYTKNMNVGRCSFIEASLPPQYQFCYDQSKNNPWVPLNLRDMGSDGMLTYPNGSLIEAIPQGPTQVESRVPTFFASDECALQEEWAGAMAAAAPCIEGGGRGLCVSTMRLPSEFGEEISPAADVEPNSIIRGFAEFESESGVQALRIHYTADPDKDPEREGGAWYDSSLKGYPGGYSGHRWQQHMEINPQARSGEPCIPHWDNIQFSVIESAKKWTDYQTWPLFSGLDYGARNNTAWLVFALDNDGVLHLVHELALPAKEVGGIRGIAQMMHQWPLIQKVNGRIWADPSMWNDNQNTGGSLVSQADVFAQNGIYLIKAEQKGQDADDLFLDRLNNYYWGDWQSYDFEPLLKIGANCSTTLLRWPKLRFEEWPEHLAGVRPLKEKMKDLYMDEFDAAKYCIASEFPQQKQRDTGPPTGSLDYYRAQLEKMHRRERMRWS